MVKQQKVIKSFSLIETVIALVVVATVGMVMLSVSARSIRQQAIADMKYQMEGYASEGLARVQQVYNGEWDNLPDANSGMYVLEKDADDRPVFSDDPQCNWVSASEQKYLDSSEMSICEVLPNTDDRFVRGLYVTSGEDVESNLLWKKVTVIVTCNEGHCDADTLKPFRLGMTFYKFLVPEPEPELETEITPELEPEEGLTEAEITNLIDTQTQIAEGSRDELISAIISNRLANDSSMNYVYSLYVLRSLCALVDVPNMYTINKISALENTPSCTWRVVGETLDPDGCEVLNYGTLVRGWDVVSSDYSSLTVTLRVYVSCHPDHCKENEVELYWQEIQLTYNDLY